MKPTRRALLTLPLLASAIAARSASGQDWVGGDGFWSNSANWHTNSVPGPANLVFIGTFDSTVKDRLIEINQPAFAEDLRIGNGNRVINRVLPGGDAFPVNLVADLELTGENAFNPGPSQSAGLFIHSTPVPIDLSASNVSINQGTELGLREGAVANIGTNLSIGSTGRLTGHGSVNLQGNNTTLSNYGTIDPRGELTLSQLGEGLFDLDGTNESGKLLIGGSSPSGLRDHLTINGSGLQDSFSGEIAFVNGRQLTMNLSDGWTADSESEIRINGSAETPTPAEIRGGHVTLEGQTVAVSVPSGAASARFQADATINDTATFWQAANAMLSFSGTTVVNGGEFNLLPGSSFLFFGGPTTLHGGEFNTATEATADGAVLFSGPTEWDGTVTINGVARQAAPAVVTGPTVINADRFDLDGFGELGGFNADWQINSSLTINAGNIDVGDNNNVFERTITVGGGTVGRFTLNLTDPTDQWVMAGTLNLNNNLPFGATRLAGTKLWLLGALNASGTDIRIDADAAFGAGSTTAFADADSSLTLRQHSRVFAGAQFVGEGQLQNAAMGHMTLDDGVNTSDVGLRNAGLLDIDAAVGIAAIDRFENAASGTLAIDLAGHLLGEEYDHLQVTGEASIDGTLAVSLLTVALSGDGLFTPLIGDEFLILTSLGGVSGEFAEVLPTFADGSVYGWEVLYHPHDVTIRLASVGPAVPEPASLALLAFGAFGMISRRR